MVQGVEIFKEYFKGYSGQYVFIGGTACDLILEREDVSFRQTKDLDIVLIIEALDESFVRRFTEFIMLAGYEHVNKGTGENQFYRFEKPADARFPYMIELFSRKPGYLKTLDTRLTPIHVSDEVISLSAILLNDEYYSLLKEGAVDLNGISVLEIEYLILFKMKAWLDLSDRKDKGEQVDSKNVKKHKNDVIRLAVNLQPDASVHISGEVREDAARFITLVKDDESNLKNLGIRGIAYAEVIEKLENCYGIHVEE